MNAETNRKRLGFFASLRMTISVAGIRVRSCPLAVELLVVARVPVQLLKNAQDNALGDGLFVRKTACRSRAMMSVSMVSSDISV